MSDAAESYAARSYEFDTLKASRCPLWITACLFTRQ